MKNEKLTLKEHQDIMLRLMCEFDEYCQKHNLRYFLTGGTLIGAVRHKGFIPWDDDVDIVMPRPDYEKLIKEKNISDHAQIVSYVHSHGYNHPFPYCNIIDTDTIMVEKNIKKQTNKGVFLDIFPLDGVPGDEKKYSRLMSRLLRSQSIFSNAINTAPGFNSLKNCVKTILGIVMMPFDEMKLGKHIEDLAKTYSYDECEKVAHLILLLKKPQRFVTPKSEYDDYIMMEFEGKSFRCPVEYDNILRRSFGDYMKLPPEEQRVGHHGIEIYYRQIIEEQGE